MAETTGHAEQPNMPGPAKIAVQQCVHELGACSPATLERLARVVGDGLHPHCGAGEPCDACNARNAVARLLRAIGRR